LNFDWPDYLSHVQEQSLQGSGCPSMTVPPTSAECRLKAEGLEMMARTVSYRLDRERFVVEARGWRVKEAEALVIEARPLV
jgi:hypothetical protein